MRIAVIGPGAMGCLFSAYLSQGGLDVTLLDCDPERAREIAVRGIGIEGVRGKHLVEVKITTDAAALGPVDLVMVWVKAYQTEEAMRQHRALVGKDTAVWSAQNGIGNTQALARVVPADRVLGGSTTMGANLLGVGRVHHAGQGDTFIGELDGSESLRTERIAEALSGAGIEVKASREIRRLMWSKLLVNVGINALSAILQVRNGVLVEHAESRDLMRAAVDEALRAADVQGLEFDSGEIQTLVADVALRTADNRSSMYQDIQACKRTEIDFINGAIAGMGDYPVNATLTKLVKAIGATCGGKT
ncbi:MAG TPA: 2-dehydropantoate 2-reductase [Myxococcota bacterium]|nr:2-dehydropantoate 2-reductase [Myxococcota bacterium]